MGTNTFDVGGKTYQVSRLKVKDSLRGLKLVGSVLLPAIAAGASAKSGSIGNAIEKVVGGLDCLPELLDLFVPVTKFVGPTGSLTEFSSFVEDAFGGRPDHAVEFLAQAVQGEYAGFLRVSDANGLLGKLMAKAATYGSSSPTG
jgi:hypothetical protein